MILNKKHVFIKTSLVQYSAGSLEKENPLTTSSASLLMVYLLNILIQILLGGDPFLPFSPTPSIPTNQSLLEQPPHKLPQN